MSRIFLLSMLFAGTVASQDLGLIHGTITLDDKTELVGVMRWSGQEVLWIHHFNGDKRDPFNLAELPTADRERIEKNLPGPRFNFNGHTVELVRWLGSSELQRQPFGIEFGFISQLEPGRGESVTLTLRDGSTVELDGGSDDIEAKIELLTGDGTRHEVDWDDITLVRFHSPESAVASFPAHLHGIVQTRQGEYEGYIEWDHDERFPDEELDGDDPDGREQSIEFGAIASIVNQGESSLVTLLNGTETVLSDTNDVNSQNRGIVVTVPNLGRVDVPWSAFERARFRPPSSPPPGYAAFSSAGPIQATVYTSEDTNIKGSVIFDLDHRHRGEMVTGHDQTGIEFRVPWQRIVQIEPATGRTSQVTLNNGSKLQLGRDPDVTGSNHGLLITGSGSAPPVYLPWENIVRIATAW